MEPDQTARQVWVFVKESDQWQHRPLFMAILDLLRREGVAGATVLRGIAGYGSHGHMHTAALVELASDLPLVITFIDQADRVARVMPQLRAMMQGGMITVAPITVLQSAHRVLGPFPTHLTVADVMTRNVASALPDTPLSEIVTLLIDRALRALPVVDAEGHVVGIITDGDLLARGSTGLSVDVQRALPIEARAAQVATLAEQPQRAADLMTPNPTTLPASTHLAQAAAIMADRHLKRLPVVDDQNRLVGVVSRSDLLKTIAEGLRQRPDERLQLPEGAPAVVGEIMLRDVPTVHRDTPLVETLDRLLETQKRRVVVVDDDRQVVGIITDGDLVQRAARRARPNALQSFMHWLGGGERPEGLEVATQGRTAADVMTSPVVTVTIDTPIAEAIRLMMAHHIKRLPVVDTAGRLAGLVGRAAVLAVVMHPPEP
jgi:CBS domain-containing protein